MRITPIYVNGVTFRPGYPHTIFAVAREAETGEVLVELRRNPDNPHDSNAVEVHVPMLGGESFIGFLPRPEAGIVAPRMDAGATATAELVEVFQLPVDPDRPGVVITVEIR